MSGKQAFKKADGRCDDKGSVPASGQFPLLFTQAALTVVCENMRDQLLIFPLALFREGQERKHQDNAPLPVGSTVAQGKM